MIVSCNLSLIAKWSIMLAQRRYTTSSKFKTVDDASSNIISNMHDDKHLRIKVSTSRGRTKRQK